MGIREAIVGLDAWFERMRASDGYSGPVAHWWQNCLQFTGAGLDWRYEGIIIGYLNLYRKTGAEGWLAKAQRAGDDLIRGQLSTGNFRNSCFEQNPYTGGTPGEASCDLALLCLTDVLRGQGNPAWQTYMTAAVRNIQDYQIGRLWDPEAQFFRDHLRRLSFVPNKAATLVEALLRLAALTGDRVWAERYALPTLDAVLRHQVQGGSVDGAIYQYSVSGRFENRFFPYYVSRCVPGLVAGYEWAGEDRYLDAACRAMAFVLRWRREDGSYPQVVYPDGRVNRYPQWIAGTGDILGAIALVANYGFEADLQPTLDWLLQGQQPCGGFRTAWGFASQSSQRHPGPLPEFRDLLSVVGWSGMAFRFLTTLVPEGTEERPSGVNGWETPCVFRGRELTFVETKAQIALKDGTELLYRWWKGKDWAEVCEPTVLWR